MHVRRRMAMARVGSTYILLDLAEPLLVPLLHVLPPEDMALEELDAVRDTATEFVLVFLLAELADILFNAFIERLTTQLSDVDRIGIQDLKKLVLEDLDPVEGSL